MAEHPHGVIVRDAIEAMNRGDIDTATANWTDDVFWHEQTGTWSLAGTYEGKAAVLKFLSDRQALGLTSMEVHVHDILANDHHVVVLANVHVARGKTKLEVSEIQVFDVKDGKIFGIIVTSEDPAAYDAFWAA
ncbi:MAG: nuclear transport factor 2 family protein [Chloroflexota bacterium]